MKPLVNFDRDELRDLSKEDLIEMILEQARGLERQASVIEQLRERIAGLEKAAARSAAPFSKGEGKKDKKKPGRRKGKGTFTNRKEPETKPTDEVRTTAVPLEDQACPGCGEPLGVSVEVCTTTDIPDEPKRVIRRFEVEIGKCGKCGKQVRGRHPELPRDQLGATAHRVGPEVIAQALSLHYYSGLTLRKVPEVIGQLTGISITQSGLTQKAKQQCTGSGTLQKIYQGLRAEIQESPVVNTDDTGWRTAGKASYLMGFFTRQLAVFRIRKRHRHQEVLEMIGAAYPGILGTDRGTSYEAKALRSMRQQKCLSHLLQNLSKVEETKRGMAKRFSSELKAKLRRGIRLWHDHETGKIGWKKFRERGKELEKEITRHLRDRSLSDADNQRLLDGIGVQHHRGRILLFLEKPEVEPTNNRAERELRPAVIARKISQCSKNEIGAGIFEVMKSITATLKLRKKNVAKSLAALIRGGSMPQSSSR